MYDEQAKFMAINFPKCPICKSEEGYKTSWHEFRAACKSCGAEYYVTDNMVTLQVVGKTGLGMKFLNQLLPLEFWKAFEKGEKGLAAFPVAYFGGHPKIKKSANGPLVIFPNFLSFYSLPDKSLKIPLERFKKAILSTKNEIKRNRVLIGLVLGAGMGGVLGALWKKTEFYVEITFEDSGLVRSCVFATLDDKVGVKAKSLVETLNAKKKVDMEKEKEVFDPLKVLQLRYVKGEISKEEYVEMKRTLES